MLNSPFSPWPSYTKQEMEAVARVLKSNQVNYWTGTECREFEKEFAAAVGTEHAVALANGTLALELALKALNVGPGDDVVVTPRSFIASASCVLAVGARPVFADVDWHNQNISADTIDAVLTPKTRAVICVHLGGLPCDMAPIMKLADQHDFKVIEDCAQAHGAEYSGKMVGSIGHVGAWSFCQDKIMTTGGEGGMVTTNDHDLWSRMWSYKDHGKSWEGVYERVHKDTFPWRHDSFGSNFRMLEMQAVIGRIQLKQLPTWVGRRRDHAQKIARVISDFECVRGIAVPQDVTHAYYRFDTFVREKCLADGWSRKRILDTCIARGIPAFPGACPEIYREGAFQEAGLAPSQRLAIAKELGRTCIQFLVHPTLTDDEMDTICGTLRDVLREAEGR